MPEKIVIIGSGPAGLTASIYAARANLNPVLFEGFQAGGIPGGQLMITTVVENFPGFPKGIDGPVLMQSMRDQAMEHGATIITEDVAQVKIGARPFTVISAGETVVETQALIVATGATAKRLDLESERRFWGRGISACAVCDGGLPIFRNKPLAVIGGGDSALEEAMHLTQFASRVYLIHRRDQLRASKVMQERVLKHPKIEIRWNSVIREFVGDAMLHGLVLEDSKTGETITLEVAGAFEAIGHQPNTGFLKGQIALDSDGYLMVEPGRTFTSVEGVFGAGDATDKVYRQAITAAGRGCMAAIDAERWLQEQGLI